MDTGLTFEEQQLQGKTFLKKLGIPVRELNHKELEEEIKKFLKKLQCLSLASVNPDGTPHQTILDYVSDGLDIIIASAGGDKFINLERSDRVAVSIGYTGGTVESEYGLTIDGIAHVYKAPHPTFITGMMKMKSFLEEWSRSVQPLENVIKRVITARVIVIKPERMTYMNLPDGIPISRWEKGTST
ncbi:MAG: pyridoxamine 5'-phosphate oxidase family protein [Proteobacteria bacterium]|nr:pyridoxamine 5'-phosphate oxidase family protein [Pseudomonadota bacterium]